MKIRLGIFLLQEFIGFVSNFYFILVGTFGLLFGLIRLLLGYFWRNSPISLGCAKLNRAVLQLCS